jgi:glutamate 5-kinase
MLHAHHDIQTLLSQAQSYVIKLGSQVIVDEAGRLALDRIASYVSQVSDAFHTGKQITIVSSGSIALGRQHLDFSPNATLTPEQKQACASVGQPLMMAMYHDFFAHYDVKVAQVLVNPSDFSDRARYTRLKTVLETLLALRIIPIINENDTIPDLHYFEAERQRSRVSAFTENDKLSALIADQLDAQVLIVLSNVEGIYTANPFEDETAERLTYIPDLSLLDSVKTQGKTALGRGGMASKLQAAALASLSGANVIIGSGFQHQCISQLLNFKGENQAFPASFIQAHPKPNASYKRWLGLASGYNGVIVINAGALNALRQKGASLLAVGVVEVIGQFNAGDVVAVQVEGDAEEEVARGIVEYDASELKRIQGLQSEAIQAVLARPIADVEVIHRDRLAVHH